ncbi:MAG: JAB domain-containing protein [Dehalococcoidia bacterium]|nr:JAB domain-containing protein [Dehalococcoidia bacterium]
MDSAVVRAGEVFRDAVRSNAPAIIAVHNHPSGDPTSSNEDVWVNEQLVEVGKRLDIEVLDHLVVARTGSLTLSRRT